MLIHARGRRPRQRSRDRQPHRLGVDVPWRPGDASCRIRGAVGRARGCWAQVARLARYWGASGVAATAGARLPFHPLISTNQFRNGTHIEVDGTVFKVVEFQHVKPGKGGAFVRTSSSA